MPIFKFSCVKNHRSKSCSMFR